MSRPANPELVAKIQTIITREITKHGVEGISMRSIANQIGITATTLYYYFGDKVNLLDTIKLSVIRQMDTYIEAQVNSNDSYIKQLIDFTWAFVNWSMRHPKLADLIFVKFPGKRNQDDGTFRQHYKSHFMVIDILSRGRENGEFFFDDAELEATVAFAWIYGIVKLDRHKRFLPQFRNNITPIIERAIEHFMDSLTAKADK